MSLTLAVKNEARRLGFDMVGITTPEPPPHFSFFENWLDAGHHAGMQYLAVERSRERRADPKRILPECESVLLLGIHYPPAGPNPDKPDLPTGRVASYAWGDDYHDVLLPRLHALVEFIETGTGQKVPNRCYTDTGPVLERDLAQRAGLGWTGKNTCLIHPQRGSYFLLSEVLLGIRLEPDPPFETDHCGTCTRCIDACPTDCILPDRTLDAGRCISYLTIENKGAIPVEMRSDIGDWVFGCDICQEVCPWNVRFAPDLGKTAFDDRLSLAWPDLIGDLALTPEMFNRKFKGHPVKRSKRRGYLRNIAVALGNSGDPRAVPALSKALQNDPEPLVRAHAAWALGKIGGADARAGLEQALQVEKDVDVIEEIQAALHSRA